MDYKTAKAIAKKLKYAVLVRDWKEQIDINQLSRYTQRGYVYLYNLDIGSDDYIIVCSKTTLTPRERQAIEFAEFDSDEDEENEPEYPSNIRCAEKGEHQ